MLDELGESNPILRTMIERAKQEIMDSQYDPNAEAVVDSPESASSTTASSTTSSSTTSSSTTTSSSAGYGRRLMQRVEYNTRMTDEMITHEIMTFYGTRFNLEPLPLLIG